MGILRGFRACHIGTLDFALCRDGFSGLIFSRPPFGGICFSYCRKHTPKIWGKNSVENFGENIQFLSAFFGVSFGEFSVRFSVSNLLP